MNDFDHKVLEMHKAGISTHQISKQLGVSENRVEWSADRLMLPVSCRHGAAAESEKTKAKLREYFRGATFTKDGYPRWRSGKKARAA